MSKININHTLTVQIKTNLYETRTGLGRNYHRTYLLIYNVPP